MKTESSARGTDYVATVNGKRFVVLALEGTRGELYLPGSNDRKARVSFDKSLSDEGNAEHFLTDYLQQK